MSSLKKKCKNMTNANKFISKILNNYKEDDEISDEYIIELITHHPTKQLNTYNIEWLRMKIRPPYNKLALLLLSKLLSEFILLPR